MGKLVFRPPAGIRVLIDGYLRLGGPRNEERKLVYIPLHTVLYRSVADILLIGLYN
jgi:hypothetical protein